MEVKKEVEDKHRIMTSLKKPAVIRFYCNVTPFSTNHLMNVIQEKLQQGITEFIILISSPGGDVLAGISAYNFLKGIPAKVTTHNFGSVHSSASVIFCAGDQRYSVPHGSFLMHPVRHNFGRGASLTEEDLEESIKGVKQDMENIAGVLSTATGKNENELLEVMKKRTNLNPEQAKAFGLVHEIKDKLFEQGSTIITIRDQSPQPTGIPIQIPAP